MAGSGPAGGLTAPTGYAPVDGTEVTNVKHQNYDFQPIRLRKCVVVGGCGFALDPGEEIDLFFEPGKLSLVLDYAEAESLLYPEILELRVSGPGTVTSGGGFIGGGFGVESAIEGIAVASVLNLLTTRSKIHTYIALSSVRGDLHLHYAAMEPAALAIALSPVLTSLRRLEVNWIERQLERLEQCKQSGLITEGELARVQQMLVAPPSQSQLAAQIRERKEAQSASKARAIDEAKRAEAAARAREFGDASSRPTQGRQVDIAFFGKKL